MASAKWIFQKEFFYILLKNKRFLNAFTAVSQLFLSLTQTSVKIDWLCKTALVTQRTDINNEKREWMNEAGCKRAGNRWSVFITQKDEFADQLYQHCGWFADPCSRACRGGILLAWLGCVVVGFLFYMCLFVFLSVSIVPPHGNPWKVVMIFYKAKDSKDLLSYVQVSVLPLPSAITRRINRNKNSSAIVNISIHL